MTILSFLDVDGSNLINDELNSLGLTEKETYFVAGEGHEFHGTDNDGKMELALL